MHANIGGRFVQSSSAAQLEYGWSSWELISIRGFPSEAADLYFFAVQENPVDPTTVLALFPISQPPHACIGLAFSRNGIDFSTPINLRVARGGWRTSNANGTGAIEWRSEDHPASGVVMRGREVWFFIHVAVIGTSLREGMRNDSMLVLHRMPVSRLRELTSLAV